MLLLLSLGQATVERGFSINKAVSNDDVHDDTLEPEKSPVTVLYMLLMGS